MRICRVFHAPERNLLSTMPKNKVVVYTTIYPGVEKYLGSWFESVCAQSDSDFDLFIALDGLEVHDVFSSAGSSFEAEWFRAEEGDTPASLRGGAWAVLAQKYEAIILVDCDDVLEPCRVARAKEFLGRYDMVACQSRLIDSEGRSLPGGIVHGSLNFEGSDLLSTNVFGLTNSSCRGSLLKRLLPIPKSCRLVDWYLATKAWLDGARMAVDHACGMAYRQHENNLARVTYPFSPENILNAAKMVLLHYDIVLENLMDQHPAYSRQFGQRRNEVADFCQAMKNDSRLLRRYADAFNKSGIEYAWWACVAHPDLESVWKN